jgi:hypothetical protein
MRRLRGYVLQPGRRACPVPCLPRGPGTGGGGGRLYVARQGLGLRRTSEAPTPLGDARISAPCRQSPDVGGQGTAEERFECHPRRLMRERTESQGRAAGWPLARDPLFLESSQPAGDVRHGSMKRVTSAVSEGATSISLLHSYLRALDGERRQVCVTTGST